MDFITYIPCTSLDHAMELIQEQYENGYTYFCGQLGEVAFKVRMNKDHEMNHFRNNDQLYNVLSVVDAEIPTYDVCINDYVVTERSVKGMDTEGVMDVIYWWLRELNMMHND